MRKRIRLANKLTIMVCAVLCAVSAFFYAPMDVSAEESLSMLSHQFVTTPKNSSYEGDLLGYLDLSNGINLNDDVLYKVNVTFNLSMSSDFDFRAHGFNLSYQSGSDFFPFFMIDSTDRVDFNQNFTRNYTMSYTGDYYYHGSVLKNMMCVCHGTFVTPSQVNFNYSVNLNYNVNSILSLTDSESDDYQNGYNAGYSAGEQAGYGHGYSQGFTDGEASVDTDAIYDEAFQAGKESVDTQSYYDAGYQAGYQVAYSEGYENGYDVGYQSAMDRIANWGADTSDYPKQMYSIDMGHTFSTNVTYSVPFLYRDSVKGYLSNLQLNPNHTYRFDVEIYPHDWDSADTITYENEFYFCIGGIDYPLTYFSTNSCLTSLFVPGDRMSDSYYLVWSTIRSSVDGTNNICRVVCPYTITLYDMGPSGDTQNHIANQTDQLTNGYDDSKGNQVNSDFSTGLNEYETAENSLFSTATTGLKDFTFFDFESVPAMITGMSFIGSIMGSWFNQAGGASGVGIVLSILFSVILVAMVLGLYRWYQSRGGKD